MRKRFNYSCCLLAFLSAGASAFTQVKISGMQCVVPGVVYEYTFSGQWDSSATMQVCINNGFMQDSRRNVVCSPSGKVLSAILVLWNDSAADTGSITITSSLGSTVMNVNFTQPLLPGSINSASKTQVIAYASVPAVIKCSRDTGGACSPVYSYQWQQSSNLVSWQDIPGAGTNTLKINSPLNRNTYYRRKVTETVSGSIAYSDVATVFVIVAPPGNPTNTNVDPLRANSGVHFRKIAAGGIYACSNGCIGDCKEWMSDLEIAGRAGFKSI